MRRSPTAPQVTVTRTPRPYWQTDFNPPIGTTYADNTVAGTPGPASPTSAVVSQYSPAALEAARRAAIGRVGYDPTAPAEAPASTGMSPAALMRRRAELSGVYGTGPQRKAQAAGGALPPTPERAAHDRNVFNAVYNSYLAERGPTIRKDEQAQATKLELENIEGRYNAALEAEKRKLVMSEREAKQVAMTERDRTRYEQDLGRLTAEGQNKMAEIEATFGKQTTLKAMDIEAQIKREQAQGKYVGTPEQLQLYKQAQQQAQTEGDMQTATYFKQKRLQAAFASIVGTKTTLPPEAQAIIDDVAPDIEGAMEARQGPTATPAPSQDVNGDGKIDETDARIELLNTMKKRGKDKQGNKWTEEDVAGFDAELDSLMKIAKTDDWLKKRREGQKESK